MKDPKTEGQELASRIRNLTPEQIEEQNSAGVKQALEEYAEFKDAFAKGRCHLCFADLASYFPHVHCLHWLLRPKGFAKDDLLKVADAFGYRSMSCYLRWVANEDAKGRGINDLPEEGSGKFIEETIRYKKFEWSFSCSDSDYNGHATNNPESQKPHYHFQMRIQGQPFIKYNDFHIPFTNDDLIGLEALRSAPDIIKARTPGAEGMRDLFQEVSPDLLLDSGLRASDPESADLSLSTMVMAPEGETIPGELIQEILDEAKRRGVTATSLFRKKLPNASVHTIFTAGDGVVEQAVRSGRGGRKKDDG